MRLTVYTDYSLRLLIYLALKDRDLSTIAEVAEKYNISKNHLMKVAHQLGVAGYIETVRGMRGGLRLAMPPESIRIGQLVLHTEPDMALVPCFESANSSCPIQQFCVLQTALGKASAAFVEVLDAYTLRDLVKPRTSLRNLLSIPTDRYVPPPVDPRRAKRANVK